MRALISVARWPRISSSRSSIRGHMLLLRCRRGVHDASDGVHELGPSTLFARELRLARGREAVELRALVRFALVPFPFEPPALHEPVQRGVEGTRFDLEQIVGLRPDRLADAVAVLPS